jgi:hypothetical protein
MPPRFICVECGGEVWGKGGNGKLKLCSKLLFKISTAASSMLCLWESNEILLRSQTNLFKL